MLITGATISPDGSRVVFMGTSGLYSIDAEGGRPTPLSTDEVLEGWPTFSPDGTQIAYLKGVEGIDYHNQVWVMDADGSDAHQIVAEDRIPTRIASGLAWSPAGDRIALGLWGERGDRSTSAIYTFAPDGSGLTRAINDGIMPYWSPDGSQIAYTIECLEGTDGCPSMDGSDRVLAVADADGSLPRTFGFAISGPWHPALIPADRPVQPSPSKHVDAQPAQRSPIKGLEFPMLEGARPSTPLTGESVVSSDPGRFTDVSFPSRSRSMPMGA